MIHRHRQIPTSRVHNRLVEVIRQWSFILLALLSVPNSHAQETLTDTAGHELRLIRDGHFVMGQNTQRRSVASVFSKDHILTLYDSDGPSHVTFITEPFYLATREVTVGQFKRFVDATGYETSAEKDSGATGWHPLDPQKERSHILRRFKQMPQYNWRNPGFGQTDDHPVVCVSWDDAQAYCRWLSEKEGKTYHLPTEAQWEYACHAGSDTFYSFGDSHLDGLEKYANFSDITLENAHPRTASHLWFVRDISDGSVFSSPVGRYQPNEWGLHDMHGNVWEWCRDLYDERYYSRYDTKTNDRGPRYVIAFDPVNNNEPWNEFGNWRTIRGGSWWNPPASLRACHRAYFGQENSACYIGFRVALDGPPDLARDTRAKYEAQEEARDAISQMPGVRRRDAYGNDHSLYYEIQEPGEELVPLLPKIPRVGKLRVNGRRGKVTGELIAGIGQMKGLRSLEFDAVGDQVRAEAFITLAGLQELEELKFHNESTIRPQQLASFRCLDRLTYLGIHTEGLSATEFTAFRGKSLPKLESLQLSRTDCDATVLQHFDDAPIKKLSVGVLTDEGAEYLTKYPELMELRIGEARVSGAGIRHLSSLKNLRSLSLSGLSEVPDADFVPLGEMTGLRELSLNGSGAGDLTARAISNLPLRRLSIGSPALTDTGMRFIGNISTLRGELDIGSSAAITDAGLRHLWACNQCPNLRIQTQGITGEGFATIGQELTGLMQVVLHSKDFTDEGMRHIGYLPKLRVLEIGTYRDGFANSITDVGLLMLGEAPSLVRLKIRRDENRRITPVGIEKLKQKLPNLVVEEF